MKKQISSMFVALAAGVGKLSMLAFAQMPGYLTDTLTFTSITGDVTAAGYTWVRETKTLTITSEGLTIETTNQYEGGIVLPAGATIIIDGALNISSYRCAIYCTGALTINANANANATITSWRDDGVRAVDGKVDVTVAEGASMVIDGYHAIYVYSSAVGKAYTNIKVDGTLSLNSSHKGVVSIRSQEAVTLKGTGDIYMYGSTSPIFSGLSTLALANVYLGTDASDTFSLTLGSVISSTYSSALTVADGVTCNGLIADSEKEVVYGAYTATTCFSLSGNGKKALVLSAGAAVTINEGVYINLTSYTSVTYNDATLINNGTLVLLSDTDISALNIEGDGRLVMMQDDGLEVYYTNEGVFQYIEGTVTLEEKEVISDVYRWTADADGVYTLTLLGEHNYEDVSFVILVDNAVLHLTCDVEVCGIRFDEIDTGTNLAVTGGFVLTCAEVEGDGTLVIAGGTTLIAEEISMCLYCDQDDSDALTSILSNLVVSGTLKSEEMEICNLEITNTGHLYLEGRFQAYSKTGAAPTVTLGGQIAIISPAGAYYSAAPSTNSKHYGYFYTSDGIGSMDDAFPVLEIGFDACAGATDAMTDDASSGIVP